MIGLNPRNAFDSEYRDFVRRIMDSVDPSKVSSILLAEEMSRKETECRLTKSQLRISELEHRQFADHAPLGVCRINADGLLAYANDAWYTITGQEKEDCDPKAWRKTIHQDDLPMMISFFDELMAGKSLGAIESRLKKPWYIASPPKSSPPTWILATGYAELDNGSLKNIVCWVTDISAQKAAAKGLQERMEEALELKRQQENFIDMISHEIRNPLSAMLHCSDEIIVSLEDSLKALNKLASAGPDAPESRTLSVPLSLLRTTQHSARTIVYCIQHQRRVVDDVLTLSKLDSDLLTVSPCAVRPAKLVREALEIFDGQLRSADIDFRLQEDQSLLDLSIDWVDLDPGRVLQVLMNLTTNAIKFTRTEPIRHITVTVAASRQVPSFTGIRYLPALETKKKHQFTAGDRETIYLSLTVADSGRGITQDQMKVLFQRFSQATPKTYSQYGGSGLGLYISRQIAEMLGGAIGVKSESSGSTFTFYVTTHRRVPPRQREPSDSLLPASIRVSLDAVLFDTDTAFLDCSPKGASEREVPGLSLQGRPEAKTSGLKILVVEDNLVNRKVLCQQLRKRGFLVESANNGVEALKQLQQTVIWRNGGPQRKFDIALMDLEMPIMGGIECIYRIRQAEEEGIIGCHVPVIAVTANARNQHAEAAISAGMDGCTTKPYRIDDLVIQIESICKGR
jgi:signal transduction histidine kinase/CheY-like chemotaxis protein